MEKEMVRDPATGKMVSAPEYGGTLTFVLGAEPDNADTHFLHTQAVVTGATVEKLGLMDWAVDREVFTFRHFTQLHPSMYRIWLKAGTRPTPSRSSLTDRSVYKGTSLWQPQGIIGNGVSGYFTPFDEWPEEVKKGYLYDPAQAEALLDEAGYPRGPDGTRFKTVLNHFFWFDLGYSELAASYWADIGVDVEIDVLDSTAAAAARSNRTWEGLMYHTMANNTEPVSFINVIVHSSSHEDLPGIKNPELDALLDAAGATTSEEQRQRLVKEVDMYPVQNHWWIWGPGAQQTRALQPWVVGYLATPNFWLALMVMIYPAIWWGWSPPMRLITFSEDPLGNLGMFLIPSLILGTYLAAATMRMTRTMMLEVLRHLGIPRRQTWWCSGSWMPGCRSRDCCCC